MRRAGRAVQHQPRVEAAPAVGHAAVGFWFVEVGQEARIACAANVDALKRGMRDCADQQDRDDDLRQHNGRAKQPRARDRAKHQRRYDWLCNRLD